MSIRAYIVVNEDGVPRLVSHKQLPVFWNKETAELKAKQWSEIKGARFEAVLCEIRKDAGYVG